MKSFHLKHDMTKNYRFAILYLEEKTNYLPWIFDDSYKQEI